MDHAMTLRIGQDILLNIPKTLPFELGICILKIPSILCMTNCTECITPLKLVLDIFFYLCGTSTPAELYALLWEA